MSYDFERERGIEERLEAQGNPERRDCIKFDADFVERRLREHKDFQEQLAFAESNLIVGEIVGAWEQVRTGRRPARRLRGSSE